jgi:DNA-3-methyladenine glycosylase
MPDSTTTARLPRSFYERDTLIVARDLLGQRLVRVLPAGLLLTGLICETEAYRGADDRASHAFTRTPRSEVMYGPAGHAYVYFIYGMHFCLNVVTEPAGLPGAALLRGLIAEEGLAEMRARRPAAGRHLTDGPARLCQAFGVTLALNGADLTASDELFIAAGDAPSPADIVQTPRIGVRGDAETRGRPWRFLWRPAVMR